MTGKYDDIIDLPHHQSVTRPHMSGMDRAAQFSPFAAIVGYDRAVKETARLTEQRMELDADAIEQLNEKLRQLQEQIGEQPKAVITYFVEDRKKQGGAYVTAAGTVRKLRPFEREIVLEDGTTIPFEDIIEIELP